MIFANLIPEILLLVAVVFSFIKVGEKHKKRHRILVVLALASGCAAVALGIIAGNTLHSSSNCVTDTPARPFMWVFIASSLGLALTNMILLIKQKLVSASVIAFLLIIACLGLAYYAILAAYLCFTF